MLTAIKKLSPWLVVMTLTGCSSFKAPIYQGNLYAQSQLDQLTVGMSPAQVRRLLGTPTLQDPFHSLRWDYYSYIERQGQVEQNSHLTLFFDEQKGLMKWSQEGTPHQ
jgi:outer membrane protein assembly factor BamE